MKNSLGRLIAIAFCSLLIVANTGQKASAQDVEVSYQTFYDNLAPYGQWVDDPQYGNVWVPNEEGDFRPYGSNGHWVMTDYGNTWVSNDPWGWACYHYGRWTYDSYYGWVWIPGYDWAPAWVSWRYGGDYCGWAPLGPGTGLGYNCPDSWWIFVPSTDMYQPDCFHYWSGPEYNQNYIGITSYVNNYSTNGRTHVQYNFGPRRDAIERDTHRPVQVYSLAQTGRAGATSINGNRVNMFHPTVNRATVNEAHPSNSFQASHPLGAPQQASAPNHNRTPAFRQEVQARPVQQPNRQSVNRQQRTEQQQRTFQPQQPQQQRTFQQQQPQQQRQQPRTFQQQPSQPQRTFQAPPRPQMQQPQQRQAPQPQRQAPQQGRQQGGRR